MADAATLAARNTRKAEAQQARAGRILEAAHGILSDTGISGLTMRTVAAQAGYTAGSVYSYFTSKEALLAAIAVDELEGLAKELRSISGGLEAQSDACAVSLRRVVPLLAAARRGDVPEEIERALTGRIISILRLIDGSIGDGGNRTADMQSRALDTIALWAALAGFAQLSGGGRFVSLGVEDEDVLAALVARFG